MLVGRPLRIQEEEERLDLELEEGYLALLVMLGRCHYFNTSLPSIRTDDGYRPR